MRTLEISLKEIFVYLLRRWKAIATIAIVVALLFVGYGYYQNSSTKVSPDMVATDEASTDQYTLSLSIDLTAFKGTSPDSYHITLATNDLLNKIQNRYLTIVQGASFSEILKGLVPETSTEEDLRQSISVVSPLIGMLNINVVGKGKTQSEEIAEAVYKYLSKFEDPISTSVTPHSLAVLTKGVIAPVEGVATTGRKADYVFNALIGILLGLFLAIVAYSTIYLFKLPIQVPEQIHRTLGVAYIGGVQRGKRLSWADKAAGALRIASEEAAIPFLSANLRELSGGKRRILFTGMIPEKEIKELADKITIALNGSDIAVQHGADINKTTATIQSLAETDGVVLVERIDFSQVKRIHDEKERIQMSGKEILGYILY